MSYFLTAIQINKIFHLENIHIPIDENEKKHLIITGKNGCGKTSLLLALKDFVNDAIYESHNSELQIDQDTPHKNIIPLKKILRRHEFGLNLYEQNKAEKNEITEIRNKIIGLTKQINDCYSHVKPIFNDIITISEQAKKGDFVMAIYEATRKTQMAAPKNPEKPQLKAFYNIQENKQEEFLKFLVDLKVQEALARNENQITYADEIKQWFIHFNDLLNQIFEGKSVHLSFNFKDYTFQIEQDGRRFGFNELSDGYSAIIDIVADLILKMQTPGNITRAFQKEGIVLIDEIETHLHLELQKVILPFLTKVFPNIQFIVTTHSPFVLNSLPNAVAYDLEKQESLTDLTDYSYEALAEGYFNVTLDSSFLQTKLNRYKNLLEIKERDTAQTHELQQLDKELSQKLSD